MKRFSNKYGNKRVSHSGYSFASKLEASLFDLLKMMEMAKEVKDIQVQQSIYLTRARIQYIADFKVFDLKKNEYCYWEAKGFETPEWRIKLRLYKEYGSATLYIYRGINQPVEKIIPSYEAEP